MRALTTDVVANAGRGGVDRNVFAISFDLINLKEAKQHTHWMRVTLVDAEEDR